jgi:hypothetical protein
MQALYTFLQVANYEELADAQQKDLSKNLRGQQRGACSAARKKQIALALHCQLIACRPGLKRGGGKENTPPFERRERWAVKKKGGYMI